MVTYDITDLFLLEIALVVPTIIAYIYILYKSKSVAEAFLWGIFVTIVPIIGPIVTFVIFPRREKIKKTGDDPLVV